MKREPNPRVSCRLNSMMQHWDYIYIQVRVVKMRIHRKERPDEALSMLSMLILRRREIGHGVIHELCQQLCMHSLAGLGKCLLFV